MMFPALMSGTSHLLFGYGLLDSYGGWAVSKTVIIAILVGSTPSWPSINRFKTKNILHICRSILYKRIITLPLGCMDGVATVF